MAKVTTVMTGDDELNRRLDALGGTKAKEMIRKASRPALKPVLSQARATVPSRTGAYKRSLKIRSIARSRAWVGSRVTTNGSGNLFKGKTFYGAFLEFGWKAGRRVRNSDLGIADGARRSTAQVKQAAKINGKRKQIPAKNYLKKAADATQQEAMANYRYLIKVGIEEIATKG